MQETRRRRKECVRTLVKGLLEVLGGWNEAYGATTAGGGRQNPDGECSTVHCSRLFSVIQ